MITPTDPPDGGGSTNGPGHITYDNTRKVSNMSPGPKFLIVRRTDPDRSMRGVSPFLVKRVLECAGGKPNKITLLRNGTLLIVTKDLKQAQSFIQIKSMSPEINVEITEHAHLNKSRGVIKCRELIGVSDEEIIQEMSDQFVSEIFRLRRKIDGSEIGVYFFTFSTTDLPTHVNVGYLRVRVETYIPNPMRCWQCLKFNHTKTSCTAKSRVCGNCSEEYHLTEEEKECTKTMKCVNCFGDHHSLDRSCPVYIKNKEINKIKVTEKVSFNEARYIYRQRNPHHFDRSFANVLKTPVISNLEQRLENIRNTTLMKPGPSNLAQIPQKVIPNS